MPAVAVGFGGGRNDLLIRAGDFQKYRAGMVAASGGRKVVPKTTGLARQEKHPDQVDASLILDEDGMMWGKVGQCS